MFRLNVSTLCPSVPTRFLPPLPWRRRSKVALGAVLLVGSQDHLRSRLSSGSVVAPEAPQSPVPAFDRTFGAILFLARLPVALDLVGLAGLASRPRAKPSGSAVAEAFSRTRVTRQTARRAAAGMRAQLDPAGREATEEVGPL